MLILLVFIPYIQLLVLILGNDFEIVAYSILGGNGTVSHCDRHAEDLTSSSYTASGRLDILFACVNRPIYHLHLGIVELVKSFNLPNISCENHSLAAALVVVLTSEWPGESLLRFFFEIVSPSNLVLFFVLSFEFLFRFRRGIISVTILQFRFLHAIPTTILDFFFSIRFEA
jgi:hypothetical protein